VQIRKNSKLKLRTFASIDWNAMMTEEATYFNRR
jgi:hypothetical protein